MIEIRPAKESDWYNIKRLIGLYPKVLMQTMLPSWNKFFVAEVNSLLIGCCALDVYSKRIAEIRSLVVKDHYQEKGVGKDLVQACVNKAKKEGIIEIFAVTGQRKFFEQFGFNVFNNEKITLFKIL